MSNAAQSPLDLADIVFEEPGGPVRFDNSTDTIFAGLFLPISESSNDSKSNSIPWQYCDRILRAIRQPRFNSKDITFKDCGDMFEAVGQQRDHMWSLVETRPTPNTSSSSLPLVILDRVLDFLKAEITLKVLQVPIESRYLANRVEFEVYTGVSEWKQTLGNMMFVHSSWHARVKRLLGYSIISTQGITPAFIQNPLYGEWTREVYVSFQSDLESDSDSDSAFSTAAPVLRHGYFLSSIFERLSNVRVVHLCFWMSADSLTTVCDALSHLASLEELTLENKFESIPLKKVFTAISKAQHPNLRFLCFYADYYEYNKPSIEIRSLESLEMLHAVQFIYPDSIGQHPPHFRSVGACSVLWLRDASKRGSHFALDELLIQCVAESERALHDEHSQWDEMFNTAKLVKFEVLDSQREVRLDTYSKLAVPSTIARSIGPWLGRCTSSRTLVFHGFPWTRMMIFEQVKNHRPAAVLANVEELVIEITSLPSPITTNSWEYAIDEEKEAAKAQFAANDAKLSQMAGAGLFPGLRVLKVTFPGEWLGYFAARFEDARRRGDLGVEGRRMLLPHCRKRCSERSISLFVEIL